MLKWEWADFRLGAVVQYLVTSKGSFMFTNVALALGLALGNEVAIYLHRNPGEICRLSLCLQKSSGLE